MRKYVDMWITRDNDGRYCVAYIEKGYNFVKVKPFTFDTQDAALKFIKNITIKTGDIKQ